MTQRGAIELCVNGHRITSDCTVFAELKSPIYQSLSAPVAYGETLDRLLASGDIAIDSSCGMHFHVGRKEDRQAIDRHKPVRWLPINDDTMDIIRRNYETLFAPLYQYWYDNEQESTEVFGRTWGRWADTFGMQYGRISGTIDGALEHRLAINVQHDCTIEFRRCFYKNAAQYRRAMYGCSAVVERLTECLTGYAEAERHGVNAIRLWAHRTGKSLVKAWRAGIAK